MARVHLFFCFPFNLINPFYQVVHSPLSCPQYPQFRTVMVKRVFIGACMFYIGACRWVVYGFIVLSLGYIVFIKPRFNIWHGSSMYKLTGLSGKARIKGLFTMQSKGVHYDNVISKHFGSIHC